LSEVANYNYVHKLLELEQTFEQNLCLSHSTKKGCFVKSSEKFEFFDCFDEDSDNKTHRLPLFQGITNNKLSIECLKDERKFSNE